MTRLNILLAILAAMLTSLTGHAVDYACEAVFDGRYNSNPNVSITIIQSPGNTFRKITVENDAKVLNQISKLVEQDKSKFDNIVEKISNGNYKLVLSEGRVGIGFDRTSNSSGSLYITKSGGTKKKKSRGASAYSFSGSDGNSVVYSYTFPDPESLNGLDVLDSLDSLESLDVLDELNEED